MNLLLQTIILFIITFIVVLLVYQILFIKDYRKKKGRERMPVEVHLLQTYYKVDVPKLSYSWLLNAIAIVSSIDISLIVTIACLSKVGLLQILIAIVLILPVMYISYYVLAKFCKLKIEKAKGKR